MKKEALFVFFLVSLVGFVSAGTIIHIETLPLHEITVTPIKPETSYNALGSPTKGFSNNYGEVRFNFEIPETTYDLYIIVKDLEGKKVLYGKLGKTLTRGEEVTVQFYPEGYIPPEKPIKNETEIAKNETLLIQTQNETNSTIEQSTLENSTGIRGFLINGFTTVDENKSVVKTVYYSVLIFLALTIIFLFTKQQRTGHKLKKAENKVKKIQEENGSEDDLAAAEEELKRAKEKVERIMNNKRKLIEERKKKLIEEEKEIIRLRGGKIDREEKVSSKDIKKKLKE